MKGRKVIPTRKFMIKCINFYQNGISPRKPGKCRFLPTCSQYAKECFEKFNFFKASFLTTKRIMKCNPFHKCAFDPVPLTKQEKIEQQKTIENYKED